MISLLDYTKAKIPLHPKFPFLARSFNGSMVVLFTRDRTGTVVHVAGNSGTFPVGYHCGDWIPCFDSSNWEPLKPGVEITLKNSPDSAE